jgi:acyl carrier protein
MIPSRFVFLDRFPETPTGKVDRRKLPAPLDERATLSHEIVEPKTQIEQNIAAIWREVLHVDKVGIHDNFFDIGGNSLLLAQVHVRLETELQQQLSMVDMFQHPTIRTLVDFFSGTSNEVSDVRNSRSVRQRRRIHKGE